MKMNNEVSGKNNPEEKYYGQDIGSILCGQRKELGITIKMVSARLKVKESNIVAVEQNDFYLTTENFYLAGFIRSYCAMLNIPIAIIDAHLKNLAIGIMCNDHQLVNLDKNEIESPTKDNIINAFLVLIMINLLLISFSQFKLQNFSVTDLIASQLSQVR